MEIQNSISSLLEKTKPNWNRYYLLNQLLTIETSERKRNTDLKKLYVTKELLIDDQF
jgi:hypothetical protein